MYYKNSMSTNSTPKDEKPLLGVDDYDYKAFDNRLYKLLAIYNKYFKYIFSLYILVIIVIELSNIIALKSIFFLYIILVPTYFVSIFINPVGQFISKNKIEHYYLGTKKYTWKYIKKHQLAINNSIIIGSKNYSIYGDDVIKISNKQSEFPICFVGTKGAIGWISLEYKIPTLIIDSLSDKKVLFNIFKNLDNMEEIKLESNFPDYFKVYQPLNNQINSLRILSPDVMQNLIDSMQQFNIEFKDSYVRVYSANAQISSTHFSSFVITLVTIDKYLKINKLPKL